MLAACRLILVSDWKAQRFSWPKGTSRESVESKYMGTTFLERGARPFEEEEEKYEQRV